MKQISSATGQSSKMESQLLLLIAKYAASKSAKILLQHFRKIDKVKTKSMFADIVSQADIESEKEIIRILKEKTPPIPILSEESANQIDLSSDTWIVDPLDGSIAFTAGLPDFGVSIGLVHKGKPIVGVIYLPSKREMLWATSGNGTFLNEKRIHVQNPDSLKNAVIGMVYGYHERGESVKKIAGQLADLTRFTIVYPCTTLLFSQVASGRLAACFHYWGALPWDIAAGWLIVKEAGGIVTNLDGSEPDLSIKENPGIIASCPKIYQELVNLVSRDTS